MFCVGSYIVLIYARGYFLKTIFHKKGRIKDSTNPPKFAIRSIYGRKEKSNYKKG